MKKNFRIIAAIVSAAALIAVTGCSSSGSSSGSASAQSSGEASSASASASGETSSEQITVGILQLSEHDALDKCRQGFLDYLTENGYTDGENIVFDYQNAQGDQSNLKTISQQFVNNDYDYLVGISTPATQSLATETQEIPVIGTAITSFEAAGLVESNEEPGGNVSGVNDETPIADQMALLKEIFPDAQSVGIMYNSSEVNSQVQAETAQAEAEKLGLTVEVSTVTGSNDVAQAVETMAEKVDVIYLPTDNTFAATMATVGQISETKQIPVIVGEAGMCENGGLATVGLDFYQLGLQTGEFAKKVFEGGDISTMAVEYPKTNNVTVNKDMAEKLGIEIPQSVLDKADYIIENGETVTVEK